MTHFNESKLSSILSRAVIAPADRSQLLPFSTPIYCPSNNGVRASRVTIIVPNPVVSGDVLKQIGTNSSGGLVPPIKKTSTTNFTIGGTKTQTDTLVNGEVTASAYKIDNIDNTVDIDLTQSLKLSYTIPNEVDLETNVDLQNMIKSDFAVRFKNAISHAIQADIVTNIAEISKITAQTTLAETLGHVIADNQYNGTGQKYSIYRYDNGAPVTYNVSSDQPDYDEKVIGETAENYFASKNDVAYPALYYMNLPTVLLPYTTYQEYQVSLVNGDIKPYVETRIHVDTTAENFSSIGGGVVGSNDSYAVAFTEPKVVLAKDVNTFSDVLCITAFYGIKLINTANLRIIKETT